MKERVEHFLINDSSLSRKIFSGIFSRVAGCPTNAFLYSTVCSQETGAFNEPEGCHVPPFLRNQATFPRAIRSSRRDGSWPSCMKQLT